MKKAKELICEKVAALEVMVEAVEEVLEEYAVVAYYVKVPVAALEEAPLLMAVLLEVLEAHEAVVVLVVEEAVVKVEAKLVPFVEHVPEEPAPYAAEALVAAMARAAYELYHKPEFVMVPEALFAAEVE